MLTVVLISLLLTPFAILLIKLDYYRRFESVPFLSYKRVGGLTFIRVGHINVSFSVAKRLVTPEEKAHQAMWRNARKEMSRLSTRIDSRHSSFVQLSKALARLNRVYGFSTATQESRNQTRQTRETTQGISTPARIVNGINVNAVPKEYYHPAARNFPRFQRSSRDL